MIDVSQQLSTVVDIAEPKLRQKSAVDYSQPALPGGWSCKELLVHLIDSASNNHQRFVRAALQPSLTFPGYDQAGNVRVQSAQKADWLLLVSLWAAYNRYLAHVIAHLPAEKWQTVCRIGDSAPVTLEFVARDYLRHLHHHLQQIGVAD